jgi:hypothetical protein
MHIATSENCTRGLCPPPQTVQHVRLCACRTADNEDSVNLTREMPQKNQGLFLRHCLCYLQQYFSHLAVDSEKLGYVLEMTPIEHIEKRGDGLNYRQSMRRTYRLRRQSLRRVVRHAAKANMPNSVVQIVQTYLDHSLLMFNNLPKQNEPM